MGEDAKIKCLKCGSTQFTAVEKGFSLGKAAVGAVLLGLFGLVGGANGGEVWMKTLRENSTTDTMLE